MKSRKLNFEQLEDRRMLTTFTVNVAYDTLSTDTDNTVITLREAVERANTTQAHDTIDFSTVVNDGLNGGIITLGKDINGDPIATGELDITESVTIDASMLTAGLTIDAGNGPDNMLGTGDGFRVFNIELSASGTDQNIVELRSLTITGGEIPRDTSYDDSPAYPLAA